MTWPHSLLIATAAIASMISYWITIRAVLPRLRMRQAAAVNLGWAVTYLPSIPLGALAILTWRIAPGLIGTRISHPPGLRRPTLAAVPGDASSAAPADPRSVHEPALLPVTKA